MPWSKLACFFPLRHIPPRQRGRKSERVGWVERSDTHHRAARTDDGFRKGSTHPTGYGLRATGYHVPLKYSCTLSLISPYIRGSLALISFITFCASSFSA